MRVSLFSESQRRNVVRVSVAYIVSAWLLAQVADLGHDNIAAPDWVMQTILLVLSLGLAPVVFFSRAYEVTPVGEAGPEDWRKQQRALRRIDSRAKRRESEPVNRKEKDIVREEHRVAVFATIISLLTYLLSIPQ